jgi:hypothetical protein
MSEAEPRRLKVSLAGRLAFLLPQRDTGHLRT